MQRRRRSTPHTFEDRIAAEKAQLEVQVAKLVPGTRKDMLAHLETLRIQIAECEMIRDLATDPAKRELFTKLAEHYKVLAAEVQRAINERQARSSE